MKATTRDGGRVHDPGPDRGTFIGEVVNALTSTNTRALSSDEWHCIAAWAMVGWRVSRGDALPDEALVGMLRDALGELEPTRPRAPLPGAAPDTLSVGR